MNFVSLVVIASTVLSSASLSTSFMPTAHGKLKKGLNGNTYQPKSVYSAASTSAVGDSNSNGGNNGSTNSNQMSYSVGNYPPKKITMSELVNGGPMDGVAVTSAVALGEADLAFRQGIQLEKGGQSRAANSAFHAAATLFQCYLEDDAFSHVTNLDKADCLTILTYNLVRLGFLNHDALSDAQAAINLYQMAIDFDPQNPSAVSFQGLGESLEADGGSEQESDLKHLELAAQRAVSSQLK